MSAAVCTGDSALLVVHSSSTLCLICSFSIAILMAPPNQRSPILTNSNPKQTTPDSFHGYYRLGDLLIRLPLLWHPLYGSKLVSYPPNILVLRNRRGTFNGNKLFEFGKMSVSRNNPGSIRISNRNKLRFYEFSLKIKSPEL